MYVELPTAKIGRTTFVSPGELSQGGDSSISLVVRPYGAACGYAARHGRGRQNGLSQLYQGGAFFYRTFSRCGTAYFESRALASYVLKRYVR